MFKLRNPNFNYRRFNKIVSIKKHEFANIRTIINLLLMPFDDLGEEEKPIITKIERKSTVEIDDSEYIEISILINKKKILMQLPVLDKYNKVRIRGADYIPLFQLIDKPSLFRFHDKNYRFNNNIENVNFNFKTFQISISNSIRHKPDISLVYFYKFGIVELFNKLGIDIALKKEFENKMVSDLRVESFELKFRDKDDEAQEYRASIKKSFLHVFKPNYEWYQNITKIKAMKIFDQNFWLKELRARAKVESKNESIIDRFFVFLDSIIVIDKFSRIYMKTGSILEEMLYYLNNQQETIHFNEISNKRLRSLEIFLIPFLKHIHGIYINKVLNKNILRVNNVKDIRLNSIIQVSPISQFEDKQKNNPMTEIANLFKITQIGKKIQGVDAKFFRGEIRNIHPSQYGHLCPIVTPDREKCGAVATLAAGSLQHIDDFYMDILDYFDEDIKQRLVKVNKEREATIKTLEKNQILENASIKQETSSKGDN